MISFDDAMRAVTHMEMMAYFNVSPEGRVLIAEELMSMINWPPDRPLFNGAEVLPYVEPRIRLQRFIKQLRRVTSWPGMPEIRALYCRLYPPADGINVESCSIPGFTDEESVEGVDFISIDSPVEDQKLIAGPEDEPVGDLALQISRLVDEKFGGK